ncbi:MAG: YggT family protein [Clostridia bacterium]|nr:YggT family protein [Clostridia bacterium]
MINTNGSIFGLVVSIIVAVINLLFGLFEIALILTVISSWIRKLKTVWIFRVADAIVEPCLVPFRKWLWRYDFVRRCPFDLAFLALYISMRVLQGIINLIDAWIV